jgi:hypothetical protein
MEAVDRVCLLGSVRAARRNSSTLSTIVRSRAEIARSSSYEVALSGNAFRCCQGAFAMKKTPSDKYLEKAKLLSKEETERLLSRMRTKLMRRLEDKKMSAEEVVAIQLEIEDEDLEEWRKKWTELKEKVKGK